MLTCLILVLKLEVIKQILVRFTTLWPFTPKYALVTLAVQAEIPFTVKTPNKERVRDQIFCS